MLDPLGSQVVEFVKVTAGATRDRVNVPTPDESVTAVGGCVFRTLSATQTTDLTTVVAVRVRCTVRPDLPVTLTMTSNDYLQYEGKRYRVSGGSQINRDFEGNIDHVVVEAIGQVA
ncbi:hypothetical protein ABQE93_20875 [Mycolicibacterium sp. XJ662]